MAYVESAIMYNLGSTIYIQWLLIKVNFYEN